MNNSQPLNHCPPGRCSLLQYVVRTPPRVSYAVCRHSAQLVHRLFARERTTEKRVFYDSLTTRGVQRSRTECVVVICCAVCRTTTTTTIITIIAKFSWYHDQHSVLIDWCTLKLKVVSFFPCLISIRLCEVRDNAQKVTAKVLCEISLDLSITHIVVLHPFCSR